MTRPESFPELSSRERVVLATVVTGYVESAKAVGSRWVARKSGLQLSPASIRNCMMDLEDKGLLTHLHTSGGRLPTNAGYRLYVDSVMKRTPLGKKIARTVDESLGSGRFGSLETLLEAACTLLGQFSEQLSVVLSPRYDRSVVDRIELSQVGEHLLVVVFRMSTGLERTVVIRLQGGIDSEDLQRTLELMNAVAAGRMLAEIVSFRDDEEMRVRMRGLALVHAVVDGADELRGDESNDHYHLWGTSNILGQPEFEDRSRLRAFFQALEERDVVYDLLEPTRHRKNVCITIGEEMPVKALHDCSIVAGSYRFGEYGGSVGVIGPTRMPYEHVVALVGHVADTVGNVLARN
ncbi:MAG: heat-inducible transcription repressor HrcA [Gemmatimonadota bacterium]|nr:MAG: heat-inducible transcription repressor HrcA [Gemmatimonadota bacterium]